MAKSEDMKHVEYKCTQCGATDSNDYFPGETPWPALSCYKCHQGQGLSYQDMVGRRIGMQPSTPTGLVGAA